MRHARKITSFETHPNLDEVLGILARLPSIDDGSLRALAAAWSNPVSVATARSAALTPDVPLVVEVLAAFDAMQALYADDISGEADYVTVDPATTSLALKAVRDAIAGAYARPTLSRMQHRLLLGPWRSVFAGAGPAEPDLGPQGTLVKELLAALPQLAARCHDHRGRTLFDGLAARALFTDDDREDARRAAWDAAVLTSRRRVWTLVERTAAEALRRPCGTCRRSGATHEEQHRDEQRVLALCADAACALLVADALPDDTLAAITAPLAPLLPR
jgi:hypothetical protein